jgi:hypothetical protein
MPGEKKEQNPPGGVAGRSTVGGVRCSIMMHCARNEASTGMVTLPDVDFGHVVASTDL